MPRPTTRSSCVERALAHLPALAMIAIVASVGAGVHAAISVTDELVPSTIPYRGRLERDGVPVDGPTTLTFRLYESRSGGVALWVEEHPDVPVAGGEFAVNLGSRVAIPARVIGEPALFVSVAVGSAGSAVELGGRQAVGSTPYALRAGNGVPPGTVMAFVGPSIPEGWTLCDGRALDADADENRELFVAIGTAWGDGSAGEHAIPGVTDFNVPDLRGVFLRGLDEGRGLDSGRTLSQTPQASQNLAHTHDVHDPGHVHTYPGHFGWGDWSYGGNNWAGQVGSQGQTTHSARTGVAVLASGGSEARPVNVAVRYIIKL